MGEQDRWKLPDRISHTRWYRDDKMSSRASKMTQSSIHFFFHVSYKQTDKISRFVAVPDDVLQSESVLRLHGDIIISLV